MMLHQSILYSAMMMNVLPVLLLAFFVAHVENLENLADFKVAIAAVNNAFVSLYGAGNMTGVAELYTYDTRFMSPGAKTIEGREGLDLMDFAGVVGSTSDLDVGRKMFKTMATVRAMQASFNAIEQCPKPVIAAIHNACIGAGVDMTSACDIRYCTNDAFYQIKEVDLGLAADVGTLQRFPKVTGNDSLARELAYTARRMYAAEALQCGFVRWLAVFKKTDDKWQYDIDIANFDA